MVQNQVVDQTITAAHKQKIGNICYAYAYRRCDRDQAVYASMLFYACLAGVTMNRRCINVDVTIIIATSIFLII